MGSKVTMTFLMIVCSAMGMLHRQLINNAFNLDNDYGDLNMRRYASGDLTWKRALVSGSTLLTINYNGDFQDGTRVMGNKIYVEGNLGVGTSTPTGKLHVSSGTVGDAVFRLEADTDNNNESDNPLIEFRQDGNIVGANVGFSENFGENLFGIGTIYPGTGGHRWDVFVINTVDGNIGIGTNNTSSYKLAVKGKIRAEEIKVETGWADYVFEEDYNLPTLEEVERHIKEKGHLINIPSAKEVEENGIQLGEMNKLLLEKIEEMMLYTIAQEKRIKKLEYELERVKQ